VNNLVVLAALVIGQLLSFELLIVATRPLFDLLGQVLLLDNQPEEALHELQVAVSLDPESEVAHHLLGTVLFQQQQMHAAEKEFREALRLNASADNHFSLAACLMSMDRNEEALSELESASHLDPERPLYRARREELLKLMKETNSHQ